LSTSSTRRQRRPQRGGCALRRARAAWALSLSGYVAMDGVEGKGGRERRGVLGVQEGAATKKKAYAIARKLQLVAQQLTGTRCYGCAACGTPVLWVDADGPLEEAPMREDEASAAVRESAFVRGLHVCRAPEVIVRMSEERLERRFGLNCPECDCVVAYRSGPLGEPTTDGCLYVPMGAMRLVSDRVEQEDLTAWGDDEDEEG
jgi:hypothetical protein